MRFRVEVKRTKLFPTRMHYSRMRTARSSTHLLGGSAPVHARIPPWCGPREPPWVWAWRPPPQVWAWRPPWMWAWRPPRPDPSTSPLGVGLETCKACWDTTPWIPARHAGIPPAMHAGIPTLPPPMDRILDIHF